MLRIITLIALATINCVSVTHGHPDHSGDKPDHPSEHPSDKPDHPSDHPSEHPSDHPEHPSKQTADDASAAAKKAKSLLSAVHKAYKEAAGIDETLTIYSHNPMGDPETFTVHVLLGEDSGSIADAEESTFLWTGGKVIALMEEVPNSYVEVDAPDGFSAGLFALTNGLVRVPAWSVTMRYSDDYDQWIQGFNMFGTPDLSVVDVTTDTVDGASVEVIGVEGTGMRFEITVNADNQISGYVATMSQPGMPEYVIPITAETTFAKLSKPITFEVGDYKKYDSLQSMMMAGMPGMGGGGEASGSLTGSDAPDFTLERMDGSGKVTLSALQGQVVVLDFWATWCGPCKRGLPELNKFDEWVAQQGLEVQVFAVNVWEEGQDEKVKKFWADNKYKTKVLMGSADKKLTANYKISGIPLTVIIGRDGTIIEQHSGYAPGMDEKLKKSVEKALAAVVLAE